MATSDRILSSVNFENSSNYENFTVGLVVSDWNPDITGNLYQGALDIFHKAGISKIHHVTVPGSFELPLAAQWLFTNKPELDGIVVIGNVVQGETKHFDFVCQGLTQGVMDVMLKFNKPISFCVLTDMNKQQSLDRSGGKYGNKGSECALALLQMIQLQKQL